MNIQTEESRNIEIFRCGTSLRVNGWVIPGNTYSGQWGRWSPTDAVGGRHLSTAVREFHACNVTSYVRVLRRP